MCCFLPLIKEIKVACNIICRGQVYISFYGYLSSSLAKRNPRTTCISLKNMEKRYIVIISPHGKIKHIRIKFHFIRELVSNGDVEVDLCGTKDQIADIFNNALQPGSFHHLINSCSGLTSIYLYIYIYHNHMYENNDVILKYLIYNKSISLVYILCEISITFNIVHRCSHDPT